MTITVKELIEILQLVEDKSLPVVVYADHGQTPMKLTTHGESYVDDLSSYTMDDIHIEDLENYPDAVKVFELGAL